VEPKVHLAIAPASASREAVQVLESLLEEARAGRVVGLAWVVIRPGLGFEVDVAGEARRQPVFARGLCRVLDDQLAKLIGSS
jgi:hypothetical protein